MWFCFCNAVRYSCWGPQCHTLTRIPAVWIEPLLLVQQQPSFQLPLPTQTKPCWSVELDQRVLKWVDGERCKHEWLWADTSNHKVESPRAIVVTIETCATASVLGIQKPHFVTRRGGGVGARTAQAGNGAGRLVSQGVLK